MLAAGAAASAQGINQSVQVTNDFETEFADFKKMEPALVLPDSLYRINCNSPWTHFMGCTSHTGMAMYCAICRLVQRSMASQVKPYHIPSHVFKGYFKKTAFSRKNSPVPWGFFRNSSYPAWVRPSGLYS